METGMDSISFYQHLELSPPPSPIQANHSALFYYYPPFAADGFHIPAAHTIVMADKPAPPLLPPTEKVAKRARHSKICTAGGMRDRRMRLSLDVARRFFALQDKLGFDKASKTVQWLLNMSRAGISDLMATTSMSEDGSVLLDNDQAMMDSGTNNKRPKVSKRAAPAARMSNAHAAAVLPDKESRAKARERARERTKEKKRLRSITMDEAPARPVEDAFPAANFEQISYDHDQEPWELSGVVFAKARFHRVNATVLAP